MDAMTLLDRFRERKDDFFKSDPNSPLLPEQKDGFGGLSYFPENLDLRLELPLEEYPEQQTITMQTSTGDVQDYTRYGKISFEVDGEHVDLTVYLAQGGGGFFLPFMDATNSNETYDGGRYLEIEPMTGDRYLIDFNLAYNPYCAYNEYWSCPVPPKENRLNVAIRAGERKFEK
jgi:uncharacterized protein